MPIDQQLLEIQQRLALVETRLEQLFEHLGVEPRSASEAGELDPVQDPEIQDLVAKGNEAQAVKRYRELTGAGIAEAQKAIDQAKPDG
jgi:ribosomal protein L7/L12